MILNIVSQLKTRNGLRRLKYVCKASSDACLVSIFFSEPPKGGRGELNKKVLFRHANF